MRSLLGNDEEGEFFAKLEAEIRAALASDLEPENEADGVAEEEARSSQQSSRLAERAATAARSLLLQLELTRPQAEAGVARLLALPTAGRWARAATDRALARPEVVELLLTIAESDSERYTLGAEELPLLALPLLERLDPGAHPHGRVAGLFCQALALRVEDLLHQRKPAAAELAVCRGEEVLRSTSDPLALFEVGVASAFVGWADGRGRVALKLLTRLLDMAQALRSAELTGEMATWCQLLLADRRCPRLASRMHEVVIAACGPVRAALLLTLARAKHGWLRLGPGCK